MVVKGITVVMRDGDTDRSGQVYRPRNEATIRDGGVLRDHQDAAISRCQHYLTDERRRVEYEMKQALRYGIILVLHVLPFRQAHFN